MSTQKKKNEIGVVFEGDSLSVEDVRNLESNIIRRIARRFLTPEERASFSGPAGDSDPQELLRSTNGELKASLHDSDPHDSDPHDRDVHDRLNFDRDNFNRA
jgi:hypothetical protein